MNRPMPERLPRWRRRRATTVKHTRAATASIRSTTSSTPIRAISCSRSAATQRHGFLWQKLRMPRSFDYETTQTKRYDERLRMPKFPFNAEQREAVMTFVLGLTNEAPAAKYIYQAESAAASDRRRPARAREVQLRRLPHAGYGALGHCVSTDPVRIAADAIDFPFAEPGSYAGANRRVAHDGSPRLLACRVARHAGSRDEETGEPRLVDRRRRADRAGR